MSRSPISDYSKAIMTMALNPDAAWVSDDSSPQPLGSQSQPFKPQDYTAIDSYTTVGYVRFLIWLSLR